MGSAKAWYFAALGVVALSFGSSAGRGMFDKATNAVDQFRAKTMPYIAMLEMTLRHPQNTPQVHETMAHVQEAAAEVQAQKACAEASVARLQAMKARMDAARVAREQAMANQENSIQDQVMDVPDAAWSQLSSIPEQAVFAKKAVVANRALERVQDWRANWKFSAPHVRVTPNQVVIEGPHGMIVAPRSKTEFNVPSFPPRPTEEMTDPI